MSKNKHGDLFNTSLTEIIIILFFVLMLFALFNINKVNQENVSLEDEVDDLITQNVDLENENEDFIRIIKASNEPSTLGPINIELTLQNTQLKQEKRELEKEIERLTPKDESTDIIEDPPIIAPEDEQIAGNCIDKKFWRQCADWAWPIEIERTPPVEFLFDIGMCSAGDIVVIKSDWERKREIDYILVDGATAITDKMYIKRNQIKSFMSLIHDKSLDFKEGQTQHVARLINLELIDTDVSKFPRKAIGDEMNFIPTTRFEKKYEEIKERFPENACDAFKKIKKAESETPQNSTLEDPQPNLKDEVLIIPEPTLSKDELLGTPVPSLSKASFAWDYVVSCRRAKRKSNPKFNATFNILITENNRASVQSYTFDKTNDNNRLVVLDAKSTIQRLRKGIKQASSSENSDNNISLEVTFEKDMCRYAR
tara:strand:+ start:3676 stop:4953 length:1278 start_codon:yes stop_codon:yes gene_type:complete